MQERSNPPPLQTFSQEEPASSSIDNASVSPSNMASHTCEESTLRLSSAATQLLLLVIILYAAHIQYPQLHPGFLVACGAAFVLLFIRKSWVSGFPARPAMFVSSSLSCYLCATGSKEASRLWSTYKKLSDTATDTAKYYSAQDAQPYGCVDQGNSSAAVMELSAEALCCSSGRGMAACRSA